MTTAVGLGLSIIFLFMGGGAVAAPSASRVDIEGKPPIILPVVAGQPAYISLASQPPEIVAEPIIPEPLPEPAATAIIITGYDGSMPVTLGGDSISITANAPDTYTQALSSSIAISGSIPATQVITTNTQFGISASQPYIQPAVAEYRISFVGVGAAIPINPARTSITVSFGSVSLPALPQASQLAISGNHMALSVNPGSDDIVITQYSPDWGMSPGIDSIAISGSQCYLPILPGNTSITITQYPPDDAPAPQSYSVAIAGKPCAVPIIVNYGQIGFTQNRPYPQIAVAPYAITISMGNVSVPIAVAAGQIVISGLAPSIGLLSPNSTSIVIQGKYAALSALPISTSIAIQGKYVALPAVPATSSVAISGKYTALPAVPSSASVAISGKLISLADLPPSTSVAIANYVPYVQLVPSGASISMAGYTPTPSGAGSGSGMPADNLDGIEAAYSMRRLLTSYEGPLIRVIRGNDGTQQDIYADGSGNLDEASLTSFAGSNSCYLYTWYDQSGNGRHQTTYNYVAPYYSYLLRIVNAGTIEKLNSRPVIYSTDFGYNYRYVPGSDIVISMAEQFEVWRYNTTGNWRYFVNLYSDGSDWESPGGMSVTTGGDNTQIGLYRNGDGIEVSAAADTLHAVYARTKSTGDYLDVDMASNNSRSVSHGDLTIDKIGFANEAKVNGYYCESIITSQEQSDYTDFMANQIDYWGI